MWRPHRNQWGKKQHSWRWRRCRSLKTRWEEPALPIRAVHTCVTRLCCEWLSSPSWNHTCTIHLERRRPRRMSHEKHSCPPLRWDPLRLTCLKGVLRSNTLFCLFVKCIGLGWGWRHVDASFARVFFFLSRAQFYFYGHELMNGWCRSGVPPPTWDALLSWGSERLLHCDCVLEVRSVRVRLSSPSAGARGRPSAFGFIVQPQILNVNGDGGGSLCNVSKCKHNCKVSNATADVWGRVWERGVVR